MKKLTTNEFKSRLIERKIPFTLVGEYLDSRTKTLFSCDVGHTWLATPDNICRGSGCPHCDGQFPLSIRAINNRLIDRKISMIGEYVNANTKTKFKCDKDHFWEATPANVITGNGCPHCASRAPLTKEIINQRLSFREIEMIGDYVPIRFKTAFRCKNNHIWSSKIDNVLNGNGCPSCAEFGFNPDKSSTLYILIFENFVKYGITNHLEQRLRQLEKNGKYVIHKIKNFENGRHARDLENMIKKKLGGSYVTETICPAGWTETLSLEKLPEIDKLICIN